MNVLRITFMAILLVACGTPPVRIVAPTQVSIFITYAPFLQPTADQFIACAQNNPSIALILNPVPAEQSILPGQLIRIGMGESFLEDPNVFQVGTEAIQVIVHRDNPLAEISATDLRAIFSGETTSWDMNGSNPIQVWTYPSGDGLRESFDQVILGTSQAASQANIAPNPEAMMEAVAMDSSAIGTIPASWLSSANQRFIDQVKVVNLETSLVERLTQPILAQSSQTPNGEVKELLQCLQTLNSIEP